MKNRRNYYRILNVQPDAPTEVIRSSYRTMMQRLKMHPDLGGNHEDAALVNEAYAVLMNSMTRADYDADIGIANQRSDYSTTAHGNQMSRTRTGAADETRSNGDERCLFCHANCRGAALLDSDDSCSHCGSALFPAQQQRLEAETQRAIQRVAKRLPVRFWTRWPQVDADRGQSEDLSLSGMQLRTDEALLSGQIIKVAADVLDAVATVVDRQRLEATQGYRWRVGLMFNTLRVKGSRGTFVSVDA